MKTYHSKGMTLCVSFPKFIYYWQCLILNTDVLTCF
jgi:hypothetical protein